MQSSLLSHSLAVEFPELKDAIHSLKMNNAHFKHMMEKHDALDSEITASEEGVKPMNDDTLKDLKIKRLHLKEEMYQLASTFTPTVE